MPKEWKIKLKKAYDLFLSECTNLSKINDSNVVKFFEFFETPEYGCLVMEYCPDLNFYQFLK